MPTNRDMTVIDSAALSEWVDTCGFTTRELNASIGRSRAYLDTCIRKGKITTPTYNLLLERYGLPAGSFLPKPKKTETRDGKFKMPEKDSNAQQNHDGEYWLQLKYSKDYVKLQLMFGDELVKGGFSKIRQPGDSLLDFCQAISYAAHIIYKFVEQDEIEKGETK